MIAHLTDTPVLRTERLVLRAPKASDFDALVPFITSDRARFVGGGADKTLGDAWRILAIFAGHWHLRGFGLFVAEDARTGTPIGSVGPWYPGDWPEHELGWTIWAPEAEGKGCAFEAVMRVRAHAYDDLGWQTAVSYIDERNDRSLALARRLGCTRDLDATRPDRDEPLQVWRHPAPAEEGGQ
ncbi:GCN5-related protein N-acetyltransferase [Roseibacterium elongatum DSM 19469]|uniref:GCN5-related protein N-acetyltransferase n=1 Tax=Roseicyclus elongatus DSM 19469 TaxID=1294273 RepID=W8RSG2_9RHOB|nr:GNAT family N-acetyltransferase [Roseibacterium elongatum]AHM04043.1 GCN5-related protein N-acetyltransferase [Roseibacterium elongatum DSM 19469]